MKIERDLMSLMNVTRIADSGNSLSAAQPHYASRILTSHPSRATIIQIHATVKQLSPESRCRMIFAQISVTLAISDMYILLGYLMVIATAVVKTVV